MSNPLCSNKSKDFKGQNDSTQTIDETNSLVSPDCSLTEKIGNNYIEADIGLFYQVPGFTGTTQKYQIQQNVTSPVFLLPAEGFTHKPMTFQVYFSTNTEVYNSD